MSISQFLQEATSWLAWSGLGLVIITLISFLFRWKFKFRLVGAAIFTLLLSGSIWAFQQSYSPPVTIEGALYVPVVYDNGGDLVVAQAPDDFPEEAIYPSLEQVAENLKGGLRNGSKVTIRIRKIEHLSNGISTPKILGEVINDRSNNLIEHVDIQKFSQKSASPKTTDLEAINEKKLVEPLDQEENENNIVANLQTSLDLNDNQEDL